jgi:hypothetical protein
MTYILMLLVAGCLAVLERIGSIRFKRSFLIRPFFWSDAWYLFTGYLVPGAATIAFIQAVSALLGGLGIPRETPMAKNDLSSVIRHLDWDEEPSR